MTEIHICEITSLHWPVILKHEDDAELVYLDNISSWNRYSNDIEVETGDTLIDSKGYVFTIQQGEDQLHIIKVSAQPDSLQQILGLVKAHASLAGSCCVAKLYAPNIKKAFEIVKALAEDEL